MTNAQAVDNVVFSTKIWVQRISWEVVEATSGTHKASVATNDQDDDSRETLEHAECQTCLDLLNAVYLRLTRRSHDRKPVKR
jgi:hypothetical protein